MRSPIRSPRRTAFLLAVLVVPVLSVPLLAGCGTVSAARSTALGKSGVSAASVSAARVSATRHPAAGSTAASSARTLSEPAVTAAVVGRLAADLTTKRLGLPNSFDSLVPGYNELPTWSRVDTATATDGTIYVAWDAPNGIHVAHLKCRP